MRRRHAALLAAGITTTLVLTACGSSGGGSSTDVAEVTGKPADLSGSITVLTNRTDRVQDGTFKKYIAEFNKIYPKVKVTPQGITDYEGEVKIRMNTDKYGDVLLVPAAINLDQYPTFFAPLGAPAELSKKYRYTDFTTVKDKVYGIAQNGGANGLVYNKKTWAEAGVTSVPKTPAEFVKDLEAIKAKTSAIPYYTNYHDGWPLTSWQGAYGSVSCDPNANVKLAADKSPWAKGQELNTIDTLLFDVVQKKLTEPDPTTTNWENSKTLLGTGQAATMFLGSWAISQMQDAAVKAGAKAEDIGFMPFPVQVDGKFCSVTGPDLEQAINIHSPNKPAARAWLDWFTDKSGYAKDEGSISTVKADPLPESLADYTALGVKYVELDPGKAATISNIDNAAEIGLTKPDYRQNLVDVARGAAPGSLDEIFADLDKKWQDGLDTAGG